MLRRQIKKIGKQAGAEAVAAAFYDYETETAWSYQGDRWFHAASTIKVAVLLALFDAFETGRFHKQARVHVRNRFLSAVDGEPFRVSAGRDANSEVYGALGKTMKAVELAHHMIVTSSNLATNLLIDILGSDYVRDVLKRLGVEGVDLQRGVEDEKAFEAGINNLITANGLIHMFRLIHDREVFSQESCDTMLEILFQQAFTSGIPAGLPEAVREQARIAHKTGEISTVTHDAGLAFLPKRKPYAVAILTQWSPEATSRRETVAEISRAIYTHLTDQETEEEHG